MSSPRGFDAGGIGAMGTDELRFAGPPPVRASGEGVRRLLGLGGTGDVGEDGAEGEGVGDGGVRGKSREKRLKGNLERRGGWRTFRYMFRFRSARLACGTYLGTGSDLRSEAG